MYWISHVDGLPFRKLGDERKLSPSQTFARVEAELNRLPDNNQLTKNYCNPALFCGTLIIDGKHVKVRGFQKKIPFVYCLDYLPHDIVADVLSPAEDTLTFLSLFRHLRNCNYPMQITVGDDNPAIKQGLNQIFPGTPYQLCHNHYLQNVKKQLRVDTDEKYQKFFYELKALVFDPYFEKDEQVTEALREVWRRYAVNDENVKALLMEIHARRSELFAYLKVKGCPKTSNLMELFNSHLEARLKSIKGFKSFLGAGRWLNGCVIRRRTKIFTDCKGKFKHLNGHCSLELTCHTWPDLIGVSKPLKAPKTER